MQFRFVCFLSGISWHGSRPPAVLYLALRYDMESTWCWYPCYRFSAINSAMWTKTNVAKN